jgi:branched-subunit amino acid transport protein
MQVMVIAIAGLTSWLSRASFIAFRNDWEPSPFVERVIQNGRHAVLAALAASALLRGGNGDWHAIPVPWLLGALAGGFAAYRYRNMGLTIVAALASLWIAMLVEARFL